MPRAKKDPNKPSARALKLKEKGREQIVLEAPIELVDMMRVDAKQHDDMPLSAYIREVWAERVNNANLTHEVDGHVVPWQFDKSKLADITARASTKALTPEEKAARKEQQKEKQREERELVKKLLAEHRAKLAAAAGL